MFSCALVMISLTGASSWNKNNPVYLNPCSISYMNQRDDSCMVSFGKDYVFVKETCATITNKIKELKP